MCKTSNKTVFLAFASSLFLLTSCGGGGGSSPSNDAVGLAATLVVPQVFNEEIAGGVVSISQFRARMVGCSTVPAGYEPLAGVEVMFLDAEGNIINGSFVLTDECGFFNTTIPLGTVSISAESPGNKPLIASVESLQKSDFVASTISENAEYRVGFLSAYDDNTLGFTITDTLSNKAVVGLPASVFSITVDNEIQTFSDISTGLTGDDASIVLVTDASGSMNANAFTDADGIRYSRNNLAAIAAHQFLDQKGQNDEIAMLVFDSDSNFMDKQAIDDLFDVVDASGNPFDYTFPSTGFSASSDDLRFIVDAYNEDSKMWSENNFFDLHPDTPDVRMDGFYPWGGSTAFYRSTVEASDRLASQSSSRKFILAMTDGNNNRGGTTLEEIIETANANRTPVYTIGFAQSDRTDLERIATETGATYFEAVSLDISDAYNSIQTNIQFQYVGVLNNSIAGAIQVELSFDINGDGASEATRAIVDF